MGLYDVVKDAAKVAKSAGNMELYEKISDLQASVLDEQEEKARLLARIR